jgi:two-component system LytT family response regulator
MIRSVIVENELPAQELLVGLLDLHCPEVNIVGVATTLKAAREIISLEKPDLVFLDVELDNEVGLDLFRYFSNPNFDVIFTSAHSEYAIPAIKLSCLDYLLKPIDYRELKEALKKRVRSTNIQVRLDNLLHNIKSQEQPKLAIPTLEGIEFIPVDDIILILAESNYSRIFTFGNQIVTTRTLGELEDALPSTSFFRSHKSYLINWNHMMKYNRSENVIHLKTGLTADLAARRKEEFLAWVKRRT